MRMWVALVGRQTHSRRSQGLKIVAPGTGRRKKPRRPTVAGIRNRMQPQMTFIDTSTQPVATVALVNNMPDSAFLDTEYQFRAAALGANGAGIEFELYTIKEIPRSDKVAALIEERYRGLDELWTCPPDALIVTGTEPTQVQMRFEPYWPYLARLLEWAADNVPTTLLSCLSSHASILLFDGIDRVPRLAKCSGVFEGVVEDPINPLANGLPDVVPIPHSRLNEVPESALVGAGYRIVIGSGSSGAGLVGGDATAWTRAIRPLPGPSRVRHAEPAARIPARRAPVPVRPRRRPVSSFAGRLSRRGGGGDHDEFRATRPRDGRGPARAVADLPVRRGGRDRREQLGIGIGHAVRELAEFGPGCRARSRA